MDKDRAFILVAIGAIIGAIALKLPKLPLWAVCIGIMVGGVLGFLAFDGTWADVMLGAGAGAVGPYLIKPALDAGMSAIRRMGKSGAPEQEPREGDTHVS